MRRSHNEPGQECEGGRGSPVSSAANSSSHAGTEIMGLATWKALRN